MTSRALGAEEAAEEAVTRFLLRAGTGRPPHGKGVVSVHKVRLAQKIIGESGMIERLQTWREEDREREGRGAGGRRPLIGDETIFVGLIVLTLERDPLLVSELVDLLGNRLDEASRELLGLTADAVAPKGFYDRVWRAFHRVLDVIDPYPVNSSLGGDRRRTMTKTEYEALVEARDPLLTWRKHDRLDEFSSAFLNATFMMLPRHIRRRWTGNVAIDATFVAASGKRGTSKRSTRHAFEPDAGWWRRDGDHRGNPDETPVTELRWGWDLHIGMNISDKPGGSDFPLIALGLKLIKPGFKVGPCGTDILKRIVGHGHRPGYFVGDGVYFPNPLPEHFQLPVRSLGYKIVGKMPETERGARFFGRGARSAGDPEKFENAGGAMMVEGSWYSPGMPERLVNATIEWEAGLISDDAYDIRIDERAKYILQPKSGPDEDGYTRWRCPAAGPRPALVCPLKGLRPLAGRPLVEEEDLPDVPGLICTQATITIPPTVGVKYYQDVQFQSKKWREIYGQRNSIEGLNGMIKDGNGELLEDASRRRVKGFAAQQAFCTFLLVSLNIRKIDAFLHPKQGKDGGRESRRASSLADYAPGSTVGSDPPTAA